MRSDVTPDDSPRRAFLAKLFAFRVRMEGDEQRMLDALVAAAREAQERSDVHAYWFAPPGATIARPSGPIATLGSSLAEYSW